MFRYSGIKFGKELIYCLNLKKIEGFVDKADSYHNVVITTAKHTRVSSIKLALDAFNKSKIREEDKILIRPYPFEGEIMTTSKKVGETLSRHWFYKRVLEEKWSSSSENSTYFTWNLGDEEPEKITHEKPMEKKIKRIHKELEIDMVHKPLEPRKKARTEDPVDEEENEEGEFNIEESSVPFNAIEEEEPLAAPPEANASEAADILASLRVAAPLPAPVPCTNDEEVSSLKEHIAELKGELRGMMEAVAGYKESVKGYKEVLKSKASEIRTLKQTLKDCNARAKHLAHLTFQLRGQMGSSQREANRPVRQENDRLAHENEWLQERVEVNEKRILPTLKSISRKVR